MKKIFHLILIIGITSLIATSVSAQWSTNPAINNNICNLAGEQVIPKVATCSNGDTYIGFFSSENGNYNVRLQRLDVFGNELWEQNGILISNHTQETWLTDWDMTCDNANHAILTFNDIRTGNTNVVAYRISPEGVFVWGADGILLSNNTAFNVAPKVVTTSQGNTVVAWSDLDHIIIQKINPSGTLLWGASGITLSSANHLTWPQLMPVGTDDVLLKYFDDIGSGSAPTRHVYAQRYNSSGSPVWASPAAISTAGGISAWTQIFPFINDGSDGFYIAWHDDRNNDTRASVFVQHVNSSGAVQFIANGVEATTASSMNHFYPTLALPPGSTDVFVYWNEMNSLQTQWGIFGQKISSAGVRQWTATGKIFVPVSATDVYPLAAKNTPTDMVLFYEEYTNAMDGIIKVKRIASDGTYIWSPSDRTLCSAASSKIHTVINDYANGQWIASWEDDRNGDIADLYAQNIKLNGDLGPVELNYGTISGTITLNGGSGDLTQVLVQAGSYSTNPDATGFYSMYVLTGTYTVSASLTDYFPASQTNVVVTTNQTTTVNLTLNHIPAGFIEGEVTLVGGSGSVSSVLVSAGYSTTNPGTNGHYILEAPVGTYNVIATLSAYIPDTVFNVVVTDGQTISGVNFTLDLAPTSGLVTGTVTLNGGDGDVTQVVISTGSYTTNPDVTGFYTLELPIGNYDIFASLSGYVTQTAINVPVVGAQTTTDINFILPLNRADLVCLARNQYGSILNNVDISIEGPEGPYNGTILNDSLTFLQVPYGTYYGTASYNSGGPVFSDTIVGDNNHHLIFTFNITGISKTDPVGGIQVNPNPAGPNSFVLVTIPESGECVFSLVDVRGIIVSSGKLCESNAGQHKLKMKEITGNLILSPGLYYLRFNNEKGWEKACTILYSGK